MNMHGLVVFNNSVGEICIILRQQEAVAIVN